MKDTVDVYLSCEGCVGTVPVFSPIGKFQDLRASSELKADVANTREVATHELSRVALHTARLLPGTALIASRSCALVSLC